MRNGIFSDAEDPARVACVQSRIGKTHMYMDFEQVANWREFTRSLHNSQVLSKKQAARECSTCSKCGEQISQVLQCLSIVVITFALKDSDYSWQLFLL